MTRLALFDAAIPRLFTDPFFGPPARLGNPLSGDWSWTPPVDILETDTELRIEAELPGVPRDDISVRFHDGRLILEGRRTGADGGDPAAQGTGGKRAANGWTSRERITGRFHRAFDLPDSVDASAIRAESRDGVLTIVLPKLEKAQPRQIEVSVH